MNFILEGNKLKIEQQVTFNRTIRKSYQVILHKGGGGGGASPLLLLSLML